MFFTSLRKHTDKQTDRQTAAGTGSQSALLFTNQSLLLVTFCAADIYAV